MDDERIQKLIRNHSELVKICRIILDVLGGSDSPMGHSDLRKKVGPEWFYSTGEELTRFNQAIGLLVDRKRIHRQASGKGMKYKIWEDQT